MYLQSGEYIDCKMICYLSSVKVQKGERHWNTTMTKEIVHPDTYHIDVKLGYHSITLTYDSKTDAIKEHRAIQQAIAEEK